MVISTFLHNYTKVYFLQNVLVQKHHSLPQAQTEFEDQTSLDFCISSIRFWCCFHIYSFNLHFFGLFGFTFSCTLFGDKFSSLILLQASLYLSFWKTLVFVSFHWFVSSLLKLTSLSHLSI